MKDQIKGFFLGFSVAILLFALYLKILRIDETKKEICIKEWDTAEYQILNDTLYCVVTKKQKHYRQPKRVK